MPVPAVAAAFVRRARLMLAALAVVLRLSAQTTILGTYNGTTISGDIVIAASTSATFTAGASFSGANATFNANSGLYWQQVGTLTGKTITLGSGAYLYVSGANNTLTLDSTTSVTGDTAIYSDGNTGTAITNQGTITHTTGSASIYARTLSNAGTITNTSANNYLVIGNTSSGYNTSNTGGTITVNGTGSSIYLDGNFTNTGGTLNATNGQFYFRGTNTSANLNGGTLNIASGAHAYLTGTITNTSATLNAPTSGKYELQGGTITGGTIAANALTFTSSGGYLNGAALNDNLTLPASTYVRLTGGGSFSGATATLGNSSGLYWEQVGTLSGKAITLGTGAIIYVAGANNALTLASNSSVTGDLSIYSSGSTGISFTNQGTLSHTGGNSSIYFPTFNTSGTITATAGTLYLGYPSAGYNTTNTGSITADGATVYLRGNFANNGTLYAQNSGILFFDGANTTGNLGNVQLSSGGTARLNGTVTNTALAAPTGGSFELYGGTITGGTIAAGALTFTSSGGYLDGATLNDNLTIPASSYLRLTGGAAFTGATATLGSGAGLYWEQAGTLSGKAITLGSGAYIYLNGTNNTLTFASNTSVTGDLSIYSSGSAGTAITNQGTLTHTTSSGSMYAPTFSNSGNITNTAANNYLVLGSTSTGYNSTNAGGTITVNGTGSSIYLDGNFTFTGGTLNATNGQFYFRGINTSANLNGGTLNIASGAHAYLDGTITNSSATLNAPTSGSYELQGGTISGGTIATGALTFTSSGGYLDGASLADNLTLPTSAHVRLTNGGNFTGATATLGASAGLYWQQVGTLASKSLTLGSGAYLYVAGANNTLTLAPTTSVTGDASIYTDGSAGTAITNQGTISHTTSSGSIYAPSLSNSGTITNTAANNYLVIGNTSSGYNTSNTGGTITVNGSGSSIYLDGNVTNSGGTLNATNGQFYFRGTNSSANLNGGTLNIASGAHAYLNGTITNASATLNAPTSGSYELYGGTITGGTIASGALSFTSSGGYLDGASLADNLTLPASAYVRFTNGGTFTGANATLGASAGIYWQQAGTLSAKNITLGNGAYLYIAGANTTLTLDSATTVTGDASIYTDGSAGTAITNQGNITQTNSTYYGQIYASTFTNSGTISATAGTLYLGYPSAGYNSTNASGATITSSGSGTTVYVRGNFTNSGTLLAQSSGQLIFDGTNTTGNLGNVTLSTGGRALLNGTLTNASLSAPSGGKFELYGGTITGGTIGANALGFTSSGGYLDNTSLLDNLTLAASSYVRFINGASFTGATATLGANSGVYWQQTGTLASKAVTFGANSYLYVSGANHSVTLDANTTATGQVQIYTDGSSGAAITNQGNITHTTSYGYLYAPTFSNTGNIINSSANNSLEIGTTSSGYNSSNTGGTIVVNGTNSTIYLDGNFTNTGGTLNATNGQFIFRGNNTSAHLNGGTLNVASGAHAYLNGTIDNTSATLNAPTSGAYELYGGTITGGTIATGALKFTSNGGYLDNTSLADNLSLGVSAYVRFLNGASFTGATASLASNAGIYWQQIGTLAGKNLTLGSNAYLYVTGANNTLTLGSNTTLTGDANVYTDGSSGTAITNQGSITHTTSSGSLYAPIFTNSGSITATGGTLYLGYPSTGFTFTNSAGGNITVNGTGATVWLQTPSTTPFSNLGTISLQSGNLYTSSAAVTNSGTIGVATGTTFNGSSGTSFSQTAGALKVDGSFSAPSSGASISGGSVGGIGTITGDVTFTGGTLDPGNPIGTLTFTGNLTLTGGATTIMELGAGTNDHVTVSGTGNSLVFGGNLSIVAVSTAFASGQTWNLFGFTNHSGSFANISLPYTSSGWVWDTSQLTNTGVLTLTTFVPIVVPEPSTYALLATGLGLIVVLRRRALGRRRGSD